MEIQSYQIDLIQEEDGGYTVVVPQLLGCVSYGNTAEEAIKNAKEAIELHLENIKEHNRSNYINYGSVLSTFVQVKTINA